MHQAEGVLSMPVVGRGLDRHHEDQLAAVAGFLLGDGGSAKGEADDQRLKHETKSYTHDYFTSKRLARSMNEAPRLRYTGRRRRSQAPEVPPSEWSWSRIGALGEASGRSTRHQETPMNSTVIRKTGEMAGTRACRW